MDSFSRALLFVVKLRLFPFPVRTVRREKLERAKAGIGRRSKQRSFAFILLSPSPLHHFSSPVPDPLSHTLATTRQSWPCSALPSPAGLSSAPCQPRPARPARPARPPSSSTRRSAPASALSPVGQSSPPPLPPSPRCPASYGTNRAAVIASRWTISTRRLRTNMRTRSWSDTRRS